MRFEEFADGTSEMGKLCAPDEMVRVCVSGGSRRDARAFTRVNTDGSDGASASIRDRGIPEARLMLELENRVLRAVADHGRGAFVDPSQLLAAVPISMGTLIGILRDLKSSKRVYFFGKFPACFSVGLTQKTRGMAAPRNSKRQQARKSKRRRYHPRQPQGSA